MSLRFIFGRAGSGKSYYCLDNIKEKVEDRLSSKLYLLVPEQFSLESERNLVKVIGAAGVDKADVLTFKRMAYRVFNEVGGLTRKHINSAGKCMLIYRIMDTLKDNLHVFSKAVKQKGFVSTLASTIAELKRYCVTPEMLLKVSNEVEHESPSNSVLLVNKLEDIHVVYERFEKELHEKYMDSDDDLTELANKLDNSSQFLGAEIWVDGFSGFTPQEYKVIEKLLLKAQRVNITLNTDSVEVNNLLDSTDIFMSAKKAVARLERLSRDNGVKIEQYVNLNQEYLPRFRNCEEIRHLEKNLYAFPYRIYPQKTMDLKIFSAVNIYSEVESAARDILSLCRDKGMRFRDIAVASRNLAGYEKLISAIFAEHGIPFFIDQKKDIGSHPLIQLVASMLEIFTKNWSYEAVFRYLKTGLTNIDRGDIDILENYVLATGIRGNKWTQEADWDARMTPHFGDSPLTEYESNILTRVNEVRERIASPLTTFRSKTKGKIAVREICTALYEFLCDLEVPQKIDSLIEGFKIEGELDLANEYGQIWNILMEVFDQIVEVMSDQSISLERFGGILEVGLGEYQVGLIPPALDQVAVGSVERSRNNEIKALYILGVNDGVFPAAENDEGILSDSDRGNLRSLGMELAEDTRTKAFEEQYLVYAALTTASNYLRLSYPIADHEGRTMRPSIIISRLKKLFPHINESSNIVATDTDEECLELVSAPISTFNAVLSAIRRNGEGFSVNTLWWDVYRWYTTDKKWKDKCSTALKGLVYSNQVGYISSDKVKRLYGSTLYSSVSRLEKYAACPFAFYVQYGLKASERKIFRLSAPDIGTFMHNVIDRFSRLLDEKEIKWRDLEREWCEASVALIVDELLDKMSGSILNSSLRYRHLASRLKRILARAVWLIAEHFKRSGFEPVGYELAFGDNEKYPPITIELSSGEKINLTGRIDRVDAMETEEGIYLRIVDYKSGNKAFKMSDAFYGLQIQLITYLDAIWESNGSRTSKPVIPGGMLYFRIDDPIVKGRESVSEEDIEKAIMKQLKMRGLLLADVKLIKEMDREIVGESLIIPARINKGDILGKSSVATIEQFDQLRKYVRKLLIRMGEEMLKGNVSIMPYKKKRVTSCAYCSYASVCQFDPEMKNNKYRVLNDMKDNEVWELLKQNAPEGGDSF
jgi:ATP-dependent helicase/nuclease subunit B